MKLGVLRQPDAHDTMIFTFFTMRLSVTNGRIMFVDPNKVATETGHTRRTIEWKKGSVDSMIGIVYVITLKDFSYNDFTIGGNGGSGSLGSGFLDFLGNHGRSSMFLGGSERVVLFGGRHGEK